MISEKDFCNAIESLRQQTYIDKKNSQFMEEAFGANDALYNNALLFKTVIGLLQLSFPKDENGFCEIEFYIYDQNFGKLCSESELITTEDLYHRLTTKK